MECKWTVDLALKLRRADVRYDAGAPHHSIADVTRRFSSVYVPDVVLAEKGTLGQGRRRDARDQLEPRNAFLRDELAALKFLRAAHNAGKLAVVGKNATNRCYGYRGVVPLIRVEPAAECVDDDAAAAAAAALQPGIVISILVKSRQIESPRVLFTPRDNLGRAGFRDEYCNID